jgi:hypothetical protein
MLNLDQPLPDSLDALDALRLDIIREIERIQSHLGDRGRRAASGEADYWAWRKRAIRALNAHTAALRTVNRTIRVRRYPRVEVAS